MSKTSVDFVFSTVLPHVLSISPNDYVFSTVLSKYLKLRQTCSHFSERTVRNLPLVKSKIQHVISFRIAIV